MTPNQTRHRPQQQSYKNTYANPQPRLLPYCLTSRPCAARLIFFLSLVRRVQHEPVTLELVPVRRRDHCRLQFNSTPLHGGMGLSSSKARKGRACMRMSICTRMLGRGPPHPTNILAPSPLLFRCVLTASSTSESKRSKSVCGGGVESAQSEDHDACRCVWTCCFNIAPCLLSLRTAYNVCHACAAW